MGRTKTIGDNELLEIARKIFREHGHTAATRDIAAAGEKAIGTKEMGDVIAREVERQAR